MGSLICRDRAGFKIKLQHKILLRAVMSVVFYHGIFLSNTLLLFNINHINEYKFYIYLCKISVSAFICLSTRNCITHISNSSLFFSCGRTIMSLMYFYVDQFLSKNICKTLFA